MSVVHSCGDWQSRYARSNTVRVTISLAAISCALLAAHIVSFNFSSQESSARSALLDERETTFTILTSEATKSEAPTVPKSIQKTIDQDVARAMESSVATLRHTVQAVVKSAVQGAVTEAVTDFQDAAALGETRSRQYRAEMDAIARRAAAHVDRQISDFVTEAAAPVLKAAPAAHVSPPSAAPAAPHPGGRAGWVNRAVNILKKGDSTSAGPAADDHGAPSRSLWESRDMQVLRGGAQPKAHSPPRRGAKPARSAARTESRESRDAAAQADLKMLSKAAPPPPPHTVSARRRAARENRNKLAEEFLERLNKQQAQAKARAAARAKHVHPAAAGHSDAGRQSEQVRDQEATEDMRLLSKGVLPVTHGGKLIKAVKIARVKKLSAIARLQLVKQEEAKAAAERSEEAQRDLERLEHRRRIRRLRTPAPVTHRESADERAQSDLKELTKAVKPVVTGPPAPKPTMSMIADEDLKALASLHLNDHSAPVHGPPAPPHHTAHAPATSAPTPSAPAPAPAAHGSAGTGLWGRSLEP